MKADALPAERTAVLKRPAFLCALLVVLTLGLFWKVSAFPYIVYDDPEYVTANPHVQGGLTPSGILWAFTTFHASNWHPVTWLSHMLDANLFGRAPGGPHVVNVLLHAANAALLFYLCLRFFRIAASHTAPAVPVAQNRALFPSFLIAALFAWHPLHVESVAWISERKDVLSTLFALLSLWAYLNAVAQPKELVRDDATTVSPAANPSTYLSKARRYPLWRPLLFFALGLLAKPMLVTLPILLLLLDYWPLRRAGAPAPLTPHSAPAPQSATFLSLLREKLPFFALSILCGIITILAQHKAGAIASTAQFSIGTRLATAFVASATYLAKLFWPAQLALPYLHPGSFAAASVAGSVLLLTALTALSFLQATPRPLRVGWFWFLITLLPVIGLLQVGSQWIADRYTYLSSVGIFIALVVGLRALAARLGAALSAALAGLGLLALLACAFQTSRQLNFWRDSVPLFRHTLALYPHNYLARNYLGFALYEHGDLDGAIAEFHKTLQLHPHDGPALDNLGTALTAKGDSAGALAAYQAAVAANPKSADAHNNLGVALAHAGRVDEAMAQYQASLKAQPDNAEAHCNIANLLVGQNKAQQAAREYYRALDANPNYLPALNNLGYLLGMNQSLQLATNVYNRALRVDPVNPRTHCNYADVLAKNKQYTSAFEHYQLALRYDPSLADAYQGLALLLLTHGHTNEARPYLQTALQLNPTDPTLRALADSLNTP